MARPSSTSSSEPRPAPERYAHEPWARRTGVPWALILALLAVIGVEVAVRLAPPRLVVPNDYGVVDYTSALGSVDALGPAEVCFVGSSRTKENISAPDAARALERALGRRVTVANYGCAGARADETRALVEHILERGRPRLILYGLTMRELLGNEPRLARAATFWDLGDWWRTFRRRPQEARAVLPVVIRKEIGEHYLTLKYRERPWVATEDVIRAVKARLTGGPRYSLAEVMRGGPAPAFGELSRLQRDQPGRTLVNTPVSDEHVREFVEQLLVNGEYPLGEHRVEEIRALIESCRRAGVAVVLYEAPISDLLKRHKPAGAYERFLVMARELARSTGTPFYEPADLGVAFADSDFAEQSHLNYERGVRRHTLALVEQVIVPELLRAQQAGDGGRPGPPRPSPSSVAAGVPSR